MKVVSFSSLKKKKKSKKWIVFSTKPIFKPLVFAMSAMLLLLITNLLVSNFFANIHASLQNFVDNFVNVFGAII